METTAWTLQIITASTLPLHTPERGSTWLFVPVQAILTQDKYCMNKEETQGGLISISVMEAFTLPHGTGQTMELDRHGMIAAM